MWDMYISSESHVISQHDFYMTFWMRVLYFVQSGSVPGGKVSDRARFDQNSEKVVS